MFRKISSAAAAAHSFSSPFTRPPKPTPLTSRNSTSLCTYAESSHDEPKFGASTARLPKFLQANCKSGDVSADEAYMVLMEPRFRLYSFNLLLNGLTKNMRYYDVLSLFGKMNSAGLTPNLITLNILLNCSCNANRVCDAFLVMGRILREGYSPTMATFNSLIKGLCMGSRVDDAVQLYLTLEKFGCRPDVISWRTLSSLGLRRCRLGDTSNALKFDEEEVIGNDQYSVSNVVSRLIGELCKEGNEDKAMEAFLEIQGWGFSPDVRVYNSLMNGLCNAGKWKDAQSLLLEMGDRKIEIDGKTFYVIIDILCQKGDMKKLKWLLDLMIEYRLDLRSGWVIPRDDDDMEAGEIEEAKGDGERTDHQPCS